MDWNKRVCSERRKSHFRGSRFQKKSRGRIPPDPPTNARSYVCISQLRSWIRPWETRYSSVIQSRLATAVCQTLGRLSMDTTNQRCLQFPAPVVLTCVVALKTIKNCAHYLTNVSLNRLYIKPQSLLRTKQQIDLPKHMSDLQKTHLKQDLQTIKHHSTLSTYGTLPN